MCIKLIVGLGNAGSDYEKTRHNAGFWFLNRLANFQYEKKFQAELATINIADNRIWLLKPMTYMNLSGQSVQAILSFYKIKLDEILVAHDELDLAAGIIKYKQGGGHAGHNGLRDIIAKCGGNDFLRLRIGIDRPPQSKEVRNYVLKAPSKNDRTSIDEALIRAEDSLVTLCRDGIAKAMTMLHSQ